MGVQRSKVLIPMNNEELQQLTQATHFNEKELRAMYKRYWSYCLPDATLNKQQFYSMFTCTDGCKGKRIVDHIFRTTDKDDNHSLGEFSRLNIFRAEKKAVLLVPAVNREANSLKIISGNN